MTYDPDSWKYNPEYHRIASFLGLDAFQRQDYKLAQKVSVIYDWAVHKSKNRKIESHFKTIKELQRGLGINVIGKELTDKLWEAIRLGLDKKREEKLEARKEHQEEKAAAERKVIREAVKSQVDKYIQKEKVKRELKKVIKEEPKTEPKEEPKQEVKPDYYIEPSYYDYGLPQR